MLIYNYSGVENIGVKFAVNYIDYLIIIIMNIVIGIIAIYFQAKKINDTSIVDCISKKD